MNNERGSDFSKFQRPVILNGYTVVLRSGCGRLHVTVNFHGSAPVEVYVRTSTKGGCAAMADCLGRVVSRSLQTGTDINVLLEQLHSTRCPTAMTNPETRQTIPELSEEKTFIKSCADGVGWAIRAAMKLRGIGEEKK